MQVKHLMVRNVASAPPDATIVQLATTMRDKDVGIIPVVENGKCLGIVTDRDLVVRGIADDAAASRKTAQEIMSRDVLSCKETQSLREVASNMQVGAVRRLPVTDGDDRLIGIVSIGDLATCEECNAGSTLGEIVRS